MGETYVSEIEQLYPHIAKALVIAWDQPEFDQFVQRLTLDHRGNRRGFPPAVMDELMFLDCLHGCKRGEPAVADPQLLFLNRGATATRHALRFLR